MTQSELEEELDGELSLLVRTHSLPSYERQYAFAKSVGRQWKADFAWPEWNLLVEVDGGEFTRGRHNRGGKDYQDDLRKGNVAAILGYFVLHFSTGMMGEASSVIEDWFANRPLAGLIVAKQEKT